MATKTNTKCLRLSDAVIEMIEAQAGETFTAKFENLVTKCAWELPEKEKRIEELNQQIQNKQEQLKSLNKTFRDWQNIIQDIGSRITRLEIGFDHYFGR